jgi:hypothetical protein
MARSQQIILKAANVHRHVSENRTVGAEIYVAMIVLSAFMKIGTMK